MQFYRIQIVQGDKWEQGALAQHQTVITESFRRGTIYSNASIKKGHPEEEHPLVMDVLKFHLYIDPNSIPKGEKPAIFEALSQYLKPSYEEQKKIQKNFYRNSRSRKIASWLEQTQKENILSWWTQYAKKKKIASNAIYFVKDYQRSYPFGSLLGQILQTVQEQKDHKTFQASPIGGLELSLNHVLKGKIGKRVIQRSPLNPLDTGKVISLPEDGADVYLTVNQYLQAIAESELEKGVITSNAKGGWVIMMDPYNGHILALAQYPFFDPRNYAKYFNDKELTECTKVKAITDAIEPASVFKAITSIICMIANDELIQKGEEPLFSPDEKIPTSNGMFPGRRRAIRDGRMHKYLNLNLALQKSSNVYFGMLINRVIQRMGDHWYRDKILQLGFGQKTQIEIPAENIGLVPTPGKLHPNGTLEWSKSTPYSIAMGHNILVNSMQIIRAFSVIANGGYLVQPTLIRKIKKKDQVLLDHTQAQTFPKILKKEHCDRVVQGLKYVTKLGGSSPRADIIGYTEAGKSGTSEKVINGKYSRKNHFSLFVGIAPADCPRFVLLVCLDDPEVKWIPGVGKNQVGGVCSGPIFREVAARALEYLGVEPDDTKKEKDWSYENKELRKLYEKWNR